MNVPSELVPYLDMMIQDLEENRLEVCLVPNKDDGKAQDGRMLRAVCGTSPKWYSDLCSLYPREEKRPKKKPRTIIKRWNVLRVLRVMRDRMETCSKYADYLIKVAEEYQDTFEPLLKPFEDQF